jgi:hypothetical protein
MDQTGLAARYLTEKLPGISAAKMKEVVSSVHRCTSSSETSSSTAFAVITRGGVE